MWVVDMWQVCRLEGRGEGESITYFFFNDTATTEIYTLSLHDALPICERFKMRNQNKNKAFKNNSERLCFEEIPVHLYPSLLSDY